MPPGNPTYDGINRQQENQLREGAEMVYDLSYRSTFGKPPPEDFTLGFNKLWQMDDEQRADVAVGVTSAIIEGVEKNIVARSTALKELKQASKTIGIWSNITPEMIKQAEDEDEGLPPTPEEIAEQQLSATAGPADERQAQLESKQPAPKPAAKDG